MKERVKEYLKSFDDYLSNYDFNNDKIKLKYDHSIRVMNLSKKYAELLGFDEEDIEIATLIGLLHDFGRFEQIKNYDSFNDFSTMDHADYSVEKLFNNGEIKRFTDKEWWYPIIKFAILNHNKLYIPKVDDDRIKKQAMLIRDIDKLDILLVMIDLVKVDDSKISPLVKDNFKNHKLIDEKNIKTNNDKVVIQYGYAFDINYDIVLREYKKNFIKFHESLNQKDKFKALFLEVMKYIDERLDKYDRNKNKI